MKKLLGIVVLSLLCCNISFALTQQEAINKYLSKKINEIEKYNNSVDEEKEKRKLTNLGTLRAYLVNYLKNHQDLNTDTMTLIVRQLSPTSEGVPLEVYTFTNTVDSVSYTHLTLPTILLV